MTNSRRFSETRPQSVRTASTKESIWRGISRNTFRQHVVALRRAAEIAGDEQVHSASDWHSCHTQSTYALPFDVEQRLADDFAFVAAAEENLRVVSAVALEQYSDSPRLVVRLAANECLPEGVTQMFDLMFEALGHCASRKLRRELCAKALFDHIMVVNQSRVWSRLQPAPKEISIGLAGKTHEPLHQEVLDLCAAIEGQLPGIYRGSPLILRQLTALQKTIRSVDDYPRRSKEILDLLKGLVLESYDVCTSQGADSLERYVFDHGFVPQDDRYLLCIRQIDKIGRYWGLCKSTTEDSRKYSDMFGHIKLQFLSPYKPSTSLITGGRATRAHLHVHAEMQIIAFYGLRSSAEIPKPRVIGVSRAACYLCNLFVQFHGQFFVTKTHGWLFDQWNIPDLAETDAIEQDKYCSTIAQMDKEIQSALAKERQGFEKRRKPMGSRLALPLQPLLSTHSPIPSTILSDVPEDNELDVPLPTSSPGTHIPDIDAAEVPFPHPLAVPLGTQSKTTQSRTPSPNLSSLPHTPNPAGIPCLTDALKPSPSSNTVASWEYPTQRTISASAPFRSNIGHLFFDFEIDAPARGNVLITREKGGQGPSSSFAVDIRGMESGESWTFKRGDGDDGVILNVRYTENHSTTIVLQWV